MRNFFQIMYDWWYNNVVPVILLRMIVGKLRFSDILPLCREVLGFIWKLLKKLFITLKEFFISFIIPILKFTWEFLCFLVCVALEYFDIPRKEVFKRFFDFFKIKIVLDPRRVYKRHNLIEGHTKYLDKYGRFYEVNYPPDPEEIGFNSLWYDERLRKNGRWRWRVLLIRHAIMDLYEYGELFPNEDWSINQLFFCHFTPQESRAELRLNIEAFIFATTIMTIIMSIWYKCAAPPECFEWMKAGHPVLVFIFNVK